LFNVGEGVLSPLGGGVYHASEQNFFVAGGTGDFAGILTGSLLIEGIIDFNVGGGTFDYHGVIFVNK
jgi:hypothetical protein